jgi:hypothetical protein
MNDRERFGMYCTILFLMIIITLFFVAGAFEALRQATIIN